jgi:hypothetical protein
MAGSFDVVSAVKASRLDSAGPAPLCLTPRKALPVSSMDDLSAEEGRFLLQIGEAGLTAFDAREDVVVARLIDAGLVDAELIDGASEILHLTAEGHTVATRLRDNMG